MTVFSLALSWHTGLHLTEIGEALGAIGGALLLLGGVTPFGKRAGQTFGGLALAAGFVCLIVATHWSYFH